MLVVEIGVLAWCKGVFGGAATPLEGSSSVYREDLLAYDGYLSYFVYT
jgi:hypothetical protein